MNKKLARFVSGAFCAPVGCWYIAVVIVVCGQLFDTGRCLAQTRTTPLSDLVQTDELDIRINELVQLSTNYADALRDLKIARLNLDTLNALRGSTVVSQLEIQIARINIQTAECKVSILGAIAQKQLAAAQAKLEILEQMGKIGEKDSSATARGQNRIQITQVQATIKILQMILDMK